MMNLDLKALKEVAQYIGKRVDASTAAIVSALRADNDQAVIDSIMRMGNRVSEAITTAFRNQKPPILDATIDTSALESKVSAATDVLKKLPIPRTDLIEASLRLIYTRVDEQKAILTNGFKAVADAISNITLGVPDTFKIDQSQFRALRNQSSMPMNPGVLAARIVTVKNTTMTLADTEYSYIFPANTTSWRIKLRDEGTQFLYAFTTGKLPTSGDGSAYLTAAEDTAYSTDNTDWSGKTIYLQCGAAGNVAEIFSTQA